MVTWKEFAAGEPDLAETGRSLLFQFKVGLAFLATVRRDGAPRLHPVCPVLSDDRLFVLITALSPKRRDLLRDGILRDAAHMADVSETAFELWIDRVMHTRWEHVLTPQMRSIHKKWRAARASGTSN